MSLIKYLPTPSDRMGIIATLLSIEDALVLEYGPTGTTHYSMGFMGKLGLPFHSRLFTTNMSEADVVMGDVAKLEKAVLEMDEVYKPQALFVVGSSIAAVVGTDVEGVCHYLQEEIKAKLITFSSGGLRGDYSDGIAELCLKLVKKLAINGLVKDSSKYNLLGLSPLHYRFASDQLEVERLLEEAFGMKLNSSFPANTSVAAISRLGEAGLNVVLSYEALPAACYMEEKLGIPYVYVVPYGYVGTLKLIEEISNKTGKPAALGLIKRLKLKQQQLKSLSMAPGPMRRPLHKPKAIIKGNVDMVAGIGAMLEAAGLAIEHAMCSHSMKNVPEDLRKKLEACSREEEWEEIMEGAADAFVLADGVSLKLISANNTALCVSEPSLKRHTHALHMPFMGERGADFLEEYLEDYFQTLGL